MLFTCREVRIGKNCVRGLEYRPRPVNNVFIFFCFFGGGTRRIGLRIVLVLLRALVPTIEVKLKLAKLRNKGWTNDKTELKVYHKIISVKKKPRRLIARIKKSALSCSK